MRANSVWASIAPDYYSITSAWDQRGLEPCIVKFLCAFAHLVWERLRVVAYPDVWFTQAPLPLQLTCTIWDKSANNGLCTRKIDRELSWTVADLVNITVKKWCIVTIDKTILATGRHTSAHIILANACIFQYWTLFRLYKPYKRAVQKGFYSLHRAQFYLHSIIY